MLNKTKKTEFIGVRCTKETLENLQQIAENDDRSLSYIVDKALKEYIERELEKDS